MRRFRYLSERPGNPYRLGRHQVPDAFDPALRAEPRRAVRIQTVRHEEFVPVFDQGQLGSCTANAALGCLVTAPFGRPGVSYTEADAVALYELETKIDNSQIPGSYPPEDTGSTGPWSMEALKKQGKIRSYQHTTSLHTALALLNDGPISIGVSWFNSMFEPDSAHTIHVDPDSGLGGGHQVCVVADDVEEQRVLIRNSWGPSWGDQGHAWLSWSDLEWLLAEGGDVVQPVI
ncbi:MAG: C1 family peptidase [Mycobacterium sp.]|uniref:C1 family peptidase n=1 Tax=Mycobacterium sp. TaxID=1785 RepID=UPI00261C1B0A|nr:C1 family peptidase [Mycobacterium sp.]MDI3315888.1 C1 family peptidase [Mycobacterium sp.]